MTKARKNLFGHRYDSGPFIKLPNGMAAVLRKFGLTSTDIIVLYDLITLADMDTMKVHTSQLDLAHRVGVSISSIGVSIRKLRKAGLITKTKSKPFSDDLIERESEVYNFSNYSLANLAAKLEMLKESEESM